MVDMALYSPAFGRFGQGRIREHRNASPAGKAMQTMSTDKAEAERLGALLVQVGRDRDRGAFMLLFQHFAPRLKSFLLRQGVEAGAAEEIVQDVMVCVWRRAESYDPALATAGTWIFAIARNRRIDLLRRERRPEIDPDDPALVPETEVAPVDSAFEAEEQNERLHRAIRQLPAEQAELLMMAYFQDKPHSQIAAESNLPLGTVKSRLRLALARLRKAMGDEQ